MESNQKGETEEKVEEKIVECCVNNATERMEVETTVENALSANGPKIVENTTQNEQETNNTAKVSLPDHENVDVDAEAVPEPVQSKQNTLKNENDTAMAEEQSDASAAADKAIIQKVEVLPNATLSDTVVASDVSDSAAIEHENATTTNESAQEQCATTATTPMSGLNLLAQYQSDESDKDSVIEMPLYDYRNTVVEINSDSDDSDADSEPQFIAEIRKAIDRDAMDDDDGEEDDGDGDGEGARKDGKPRRRQPPKVKGELLLDDLPPIQDLQISVPEGECTELGRIHSIVEQLVLVSALSDAILLDLETVLFLDKGKKVLGVVFDVIGQVADPLYCIRFNSQKHIEEKNIRIGDVVYVAPKTEYTQFIVLSKLTQTRGSDASWENDLEPPQRYLDYSDDEEERRARTKSVNRERGQEGDDTATDSPQVKREASSPAPNRGRNTRRNSYNNSSGGGGGGGGGSYRRPHQGAQRNYNNNNNNQHPRFPYNNYNSNSWHSNYYPPYNAGPQFNYQMPMYGAPPPPQPFNAPYNGDGMQPTYVPNPYAIMRSGPPQRPPGAPGPSNASAAQSRYPPPH